MDGAFFCMVLFSSCRSIRLVVPIGPRSGAGSKEVRGTKPFVEGHRVAPVVPEDDRTSLQGDRALLVGAVPADWSIAVAVIQRPIGDEKGVVQP